MDSTGTEYINISQGENRNSVQMKTLKAVRLLSPALPLKDLKWGRQKVTEATRDTALQMYLELLFVKCYTQNALDKSNWEKNMGLRAKSPR